MAIRHRIEDKPSQPQAEEHISYYLKNKSGVMLMVDTRLRDLSAPNEKKYISFILLADRKENPVRPMNGYSAKEIFDSKGVLKLEAKGLLLRKEKKQLIMVTK